MPRYLPSAMKKSVHYGNIDPPNHFMAIKIANEQIISNTQKVQKSILEPKMATRRKERNDTGIFPDAMVPPSELYLTLNSMHLKGDGDMHRATLVMLEVGKFVHRQYLKQPIHLTFEGLGNHDDTILYAKIQDEASIVSLEELHHIFQHKFNERLGLPIDPTPYRPRLIIANIRRSVEAKLKGVASFPTNICKGFEDTCFGTESVTGFQLCQIIAENPYDFL